MIVFGSDLNGQYPADGSFSNIRFGDRQLGTLTYESIPVGGEHDDVEYDEIARVYAGDNRMTTAAWLFQSGDGFYVRHRNNHEILDLASNTLVREQEQTFVDEAYGLTFRIYTQNPTGSYAMFDNGFLSVSNILWEFSPDGGTTWYPYYDMPNRAGTNAVFPYSTTSIKVRALSNDPTEWVQSFTIMPITTVRGVELPTLSGTVDVNADMGAIAWTAVEGAEVYAVYKGNGDLVCYTHANVYDTGDPDVDVSGWYVIAMNAISQTGDSGGVIT